VSTTLEPVTPRYLKTPEAAAHLGLSPRTLEKHRCYGTGPVFRKLGGRIVYAIDDLDAWAAIGSRRSTSDPGTGVIYPAKKRFARLAELARLAGR
jgi:predicted DNA-binding transcriptional regulator AlpA